MFRYKTSDTKHEILNFFNDFRKAFRMNCFFNSFCGGQHEKLAVEKWNWGKTAALLARKSVSL